MGDTPSGFQYIVIDIGVYQRVVVIYCHLSKLSVGQTPLYARIPPIFVNSILSIVS